MSAEDTKLGEAVLVLTTDNNGFRMGIEDAHMAANAMQKNLDKAHNQIKEQFAEKFEHVGVHLFGKDMLRAIGITEGAGPILGALKLGVNHLAEAFGLATGPMGMAFMGLTALAAVAWKVHESNTKQAESLEKVKKEQFESFKTTHDLVGEMEKLNTATIKYIPNLDNLYNATKRLDDIQRHNVTTTGGQLLGSIQKQMLANIDQQQGLEEYIEALKREQNQNLVGSYAYEEKGRVIGRVNGQLTTLKEKHDTLRASMEKTKADIAAQGAGFTSAEDRIKKASAALDAFNEKNKKVPTFFRTVFF